MRAERKGPLLTPQHISRAGREPDALRRRRSNPARVNSNVSVTSLSPQRTEELTDPRNESYIYIYMCHSRVTSAPSLIITELSKLSSLIIFR